MLKQQAGGRTEGGLEFHRRGAVEEAPYGKKSPKDELDGAAKSITEKIAAYNKTVK